MAKIFRFGGIWPLCVGYKLCACACTTPSVFFQPKTVSENWRMCFLWLSINSSCQKGIIFEFDTFKTTSPQMKLEPIYKSLKIMDLPKYFSQLFNFNFLKSKFDRKLRIVPRVSPHKSISVFHFIQENLQGRNKEMGKKLVQKFFLR